MSKVKVKNQLFTLIFTAKAYYLLTYLLLRFLFIFCPSEKLVLECTVQLLQ